TRLGTGTVLDQARRPNRGQIPHRDPTFDLPTGDHTAVEGEPELFQGRRTRKTSPQLPIIGVPQVQVTFARITLWGDGQLRAVRAEGHVTHRLLRPHRERVSGVEFDHDRTLGGPACQKTTVRGER